MRAKLLIALCLTALAVPASARNAEDYWCGKGKDKIHLMMWIAKVQEPIRNDDGKLIRDDKGDLMWARAADGRTYSQYGIINHTLPENHPNWVTLVPKGWIRFDTEDNIYFRGQKCTVFTEKDQDKYGVGYFGPRHDLRYPHIKENIPEVIKPAERRVSEPAATRFCVAVIEPPPEVVKDPEYDEGKWLALREGPGPQFKLIAKLGGNKHLEADATQGDWTHISNVTRLSSTDRNNPQIVQGWARSKYVKKFPCENETTDEPTRGRPEEKDAEWCRAHDHKDAACINPSPNMQSAPSRAAPVGLVGANPDATPDKADTPTIPPAVLNAASQFDNFALNAVRKTVAEVATNLAQSNKTTAAEFIMAAKRVGLTPESQLTPQVLSDPAAAAPIARVAGIGNNLSDEQWRQAHAIALQASRTRQAENAAIAATGQSVPNPGQAAPQPQRAHPAPPLECAKLPGTNSIDCRRTDYGPPAPTMDDAPNWLR